MKCEDACIKMSLFFDNELSSEEKTHLMEHLEHCQNCKEEWIQLQNVMNLLSELPPLELPENYHAELMEKLKAEQVQASPFSVPKKHKTSLGRYWGTAAVAAIALLTITSNHGFDELFQLHEQKNNLQSATLNQEPLEKENSAINQKEISPSTLSPEDFSSPKEEKIIPSSEIAAEPDKQTTTNHSESYFSKAIPEMQSSAVAKTPPESEETKNTDAATASEASTDSGEQEKKEEDIPKEKTKEKVPDKTSEKKEAAQLTSTLAMTPQSDSVVTQHIDLVLSVSESKAALSSIENICKNHQGTITDNTLNTDSSFEGNISLELPSKSVSSFLQDLNSVGAISEKHESTSKEMKSTLSTGAGSQMTAISIQLASSES